MKETKEETARRMYPINLAKKNRRRRWLDKIKLAFGCEICGYKEHACALDFDHIDPTTKAFGISASILTSLPRLFNEIRKCRILCANCHRVVTRDEKHTGLNRKYHD